MTGADMTSDVRNMMIDAAASIVTGGDE